VKVFLRAESEASLCWECRGKAKVTIELCKGLRVSFCRRCCAELRSCLPAFGVRSAPKTIRELREAPEDTVEEYTRRLRAVVLPPPELARQMIGIPKAILFGDPPCTCPRPVFHPGKGWDGNPDHPPHLGSFGCQHIDLTCPVHGEKVD